MASGSAGGRSGKGRTRSAAAKRGYARASVNSVGGTAVAAEISSIMGNVFKSEGYRDIRRKSSY